MATYLLLDGHSLAFRAWFALQEAGMRTSSGQETQAVYGFVSMTTKLLGDFRPDGMGVAFDRPEPTFRDALAPDYKAGRPDAPEPLREQIGLIREFVAALGLPCLDAAGYEADDVIATLAGRLAAAGEDVIIVTGDRDAFQLVADPHVKVLYNRRGVSDYVLYDEAGIAERTGVPPVQYPFLAALRGDPSDNIPGVPGVGEKTAAKLVTTYGDVDTLYGSLASCTPKLRENLAAYEARVRLNLELTPAARAVPIEVATEDLRLGREDREALSGLFGLLEMRTPRDRLLGVLDELARARAAGGPAGEAAPPVDGGELPDEPRPVAVLDAAAAAAALRAAAAGRGPIVVEPAWSGPPGRSPFSGLAVLCPGRDEVAFLPGDVLGDDAVRAGLRAAVGLGGAGERRLVAHRAKELMRAFLSLGCDATGLELDTAVAAYLVDPPEGQASLQAVAENQGLPGVIGPRPEGKDGQLGFDLDGKAPSLAEATARRADPAPAPGRRPGAGPDDAGAPRVPAGS